MKPRQYEGMFLFDAGFAADFAQTEAEVQRIMGRAEAEVLFCRKWDERRLAYEIKGRKRGTYVLTYFRAAPAAISGLQRDVQLSESVLRVLVLGADHVAPEDMSKFMFDRKAEAPEGEAPRGARPAAEKAAPKTAEKPSTIAAPETPAEPTKPAGPAEAAPAAPGAEPEAVASAAAAEPEADAETAEA